MIEYFIHHALVKAVKTSKRRREAELYSIHSDLTHQSSAAVRWNSDRGESSSSVQEYSEIAVEWE